MTKHLRIMLLALLALVCHAVQAEEAVFATLSFPDGNSEKISSYTKKWSATIDDYTWSIVNFNNNGNTWSSIKCGSKSAASTATIGTTNMATAVTKVVVNYSTINTPEKINSVKLIVASDDAFKNVVETLTADKLAATTKTSEFVITSPKENQYYQLVFDCAKTSSNGIIEVKTVDYYHNAAADKTSTKTTFGADYDGKTFNFVNGVLEGFSAPKATCTTAGSMAYTSSDEAIVKVDANGQLNFTNTKFGEARITATFTPTDAATYAGSSASYTVTNTKSYTSIADLKKDITSTEADFLLNLTDAVVTYVNENNAYMQDATAGILVYVSSHGLAAGDKLTGKVTGKTKLYNGLAEITAWTPDASLVKTADADIPVEEVTLAELTGDNYANYESKRVKVIGVTVTSALSNRNATISQNGTDMAVRAGVSSGLTMTANQVLDITGYPGIFTQNSTSTKQLNVWEQADITEHKEADSRQDAGLKFEKDSYTADINKEEFDGAVLTNPNNLTVTYSISPETDDAMIDETSGYITYTKEATYTVTATFAGNDTYKPATASYMLTIVDPNYDTKVVTFDATVDKGKTTGTTADEMSKDQVTISSTSAALGNGTNYRFYGNGTTHTFTTSSIGNITKIEFQGDDASYPLIKLELKDEETNGTFTSEPLKATWTGEAKEVVFTTKAQARATQIIVTIKAPVAKDYGTLDEDAADNSNKVQTAWDNVNITLKRTLYADDGWNTLCLPFSLTAEQAEEAFGTVTLRQIDADKSTGNTITFKEATTIEAGVPYLIKVTKVAEDNTYNFTGVKVTGNLRDNVNVKAGNAEFVGNFDNTQVSELPTSYTVACLGADNKLFRAETNSYFKGFRAYFLLPKAAQAEAIKVVIDGTTTGIGDLQIDGARANGRVYNLAGQCVGTSMDGLKAGVYIQNGKKVIKK